MLVATVEVSAWGHADDPRGDTPDGALAALSGSLDRREVRVGADLILRAHRGLRDRDDRPTVSTRPAGQPEDPRPVLEYPRCHQGLRATLRAGAVLVHSRSIGRHAVVC